MRIAYIVETFLPTVNGVVVSILSLSAELGRRGHLVAIYCPSPGRGERIVWTAPGVSIFPSVSVPSIIYPDFRIAAPTPKSLFKLRNFKPDIVHLHGPGPLGIEGLINGKILKKPLIGSFNTYFMEPEYLRLVKLERYQRVSAALWKLVVGFYNKCDVVVVPSEETVHEVKAHGVKKPVKCIPNGSDFSFTKKVRKVDVERIQRKYSLGEQVVLYVGRLSREKSLDVLVKAFAKVANAVSEAQLLIVGDGPVRKELELLAGDLGLGDRVIFTGMIKHSELVKSGIFQTCSLFCTPSTSETQGLSVIEAMGAGLPVVGVAARGVKEVVDDNGVLVRPGDIEGMASAIVDLLQSPKKLEEYSKRSRKAAKQYSIGKVAKRTEELYFSLVI